MLLISLMEDVELLSWTVWTLEHPVRDSVTQQYRNLEDGKSKTPLRVSQTFGLFIYLPYRKCEDA